MGKMGFVIHYTAIAPLRGTKQPISQTVNRNNYFMNETPWIFGLHSNYVYDYPV
jgi:hypothetical protein